MQIDQSKFTKFNLLESNNSSCIYKPKTGPSNRVKIPRCLDSKIAYLIGLILGDGHLTIAKKRIALEMTSERLVENASKLFFETFGIGPKIFSRRRKERKETFYFNLDSSVLQQLFNNLGVPIGKKSAIIKVPDYLYNESFKIKGAFLNGVFDSEGGRRRWKYYGISTASKEFQEGIIALLKSIKIPSNKESWIDKKYKRRYYGLYFERSALRLLRGCRSGQTGWRDCDLL